MPVQRSALRSFVLALLGCALIAAAWTGNAHAAEGAAPMHWSADKTIWDRKTNRVELIGKATVRQPGELLTADRITLDLNTRDLDAQGNCVYIASESVIHGDEMHFNLETRTGVIVGGRVSTDAFTLTGERINKLGDRRFQTQQGAYSTCRDCPQSWTLFSESVDMEIEGYAYLSGVSARIKDAPFVWVPYLIIPLKTQRQTGLLFPKFGFTGDGFRFVLPVFVTLGRSADMTIGLGEYGGRGFRGEWEGRYRLSDRSYGEAQFYYLNDSTFEEYLRGRNGATAGSKAQLKSHRWALDVRQTQELPFGLEQKLRLLDASDNSYPTQVGDIQGAGEAYISSNLIFSHTTNQVSTYLAAQRTRNLLYSHPVDFDPNTVQVYPSFAMATNDKFLFGSPIAAGLTVGLTNFTRTASAYDIDLATPVAPGAPIRPGIDPIRKATRFSYTPRVYTTLRPFGLFSIVPSAEYRGYYYNFHQEIPNLSRGYLQLKNELSFQLEKIYETSDPDAPRIKHLIRPNLTYSLIPAVHETFPGSNAGQRHPFLQQIAYARDSGFSGYNFDNYDIVPLDQSKTYTNYFLPQGNAISYGFTSQLIRRKGRVEAEDASYQTAVEFKAGQAYNFRSMKEGGDQQPFSRFFSSLILEGDWWNSTTNYIYAPYVPITPIQDRHILSTSLNVVIDRTIHQRILEFDRSFSIGYSRSTIGSRTSNLNGAFSYSLNDYILPSVGVSRDFNSGKWLNFESHLRFQSPSQCWRFEVGLVRRTCDKPQGYCVDFDMNLSLNLTGEGFGGVSEAASSMLPR